MHIINERIDLLRNSMRLQGISACIIPGTDPHASEYFADYWKEREWISGFDGSMGTAVVTTEKAGIWTDSRYFLQADTQLKGTEFVSMKMGLPGTPNILPWLSSVLKPGDKVGVNPQMFSMSAFNTIQQDLKRSDIELVSIDLIQGIWVDRPALPDSPFFIYPTSFTGKDSKEKCALIQKELQAARVDACILPSLDDIAWLFNIRGKDVSYNPLVIAYALITVEKVTLYIDPKKINDENRAYLNNLDVVTKNYTDIYDDLKTLPTNYRVMVDGNKLNQSLYESVPDGCEIISQLSPVAILKSIKNDVELSGFRKAMIKDGIALTRFFMWLEGTVANTKQTEVSIAVKLDAFRREQGNYFGESFGAIVGYADHGAVIHYKADENSAYKLLPENILLLDSGGQYLEGTTDITRTTVLGQATEQQKTDFTLVLKGHIGLATAVFPTGTRGSQLDILARKSMWERGINYLHGTGHGVGHFLNVHEGPQSIRMEENPVLLQPGMILSNEPGIYRNGEYGIRIENLIHVIQKEETTFGSFLQFETLTLFPIEQKLINKSLLNEQELQWLNDYHQRVYESLAPHLNDTEQKWLKEKTKNL